MFSPLFSSLHPIPLNTLIGRNSIRESAKSGWLDRSFERFEDEGIQAFAFAEGPDGKCPVHLRSGQFSDKKSRSYSRIAENPRAVEASSWEENLSIAFVAARSSALDKRYE